MPSPIWRAPRATTIWAVEADARAGRIRKQIEKEYFLPQTSFYAFSWNGHEAADPTATIFPSVAWWDGDYALDHSSAMLSRWASEEFSTDWGTRLLSDQASFYDPLVIIRARFGRSLPDGSRLRNIAQAALSLAMHT